MQKKRPCGALFAERRTFKWAKYAVAGVIGILVFQPDLALGLGRRRYHRDGP